MAMVNISVPKTTKNYQKHFSI